MRRDKGALPPSDDIGTIPEMSARLSRRLFLSGATAAMACSVLRAQTVDSLHGRVRPAISVPDFHVVCADGSSITLHRLLADQATAIQLMFTACRTTCPMEGAIFEKVQELIPDQAHRRIQLLSLSINPGGEEPGALNTWLKRYHARAGWTAASPASQDIPALNALFGQGRSVNDPHSTQVQIIDRHRQLIWRTSELPSAAEVAAILTKL